MAAIVVLDGERERAGTSPGARLLSPDEVVACATTAPACVVGRVPGLGTFMVGAPADVAIFDLVDRPVEFVDPQQTGSWV
jgi:predicted amidohydrolase